MARRFVRCAGMLTRRSPALMKFSRKRASRSGLGVCDKAAGHQRNPEAAFGSDDLVDARSHCGLEPERRGARERVGSSQVRRREPRDLVQALVVARAFGGDHHTAARPHNPPESASRSGLVWRSIRSSLRQLSRRGYMASNPPGRAPGPFPGRWNPGPIRPCPGCGGWVISGCAVGAVPNATMAVPAPRAAPATSRAPAIMPRVRCLTCLESPPAGLVLSGSLRR
jgi:hypothetical protein